MVRVGIKVYHVLKTGDEKIPTDGADITKVKGDFELKLLQKTANNFLILAQEDMMCLQIVENAKTIYNKYRDAR